MLAVWALLVVSALMDNLGVHLGLIRTAPIAWLIFLVTQAALLLRQHARELGALNATLADRAGTLEERNRDIRRLNADLRLQIHDRSARLADALGRIGPLSNQLTKPLTIGATVGGRYKVMRCIGKGGMGAVYEVEREPDEKRFALKTLMLANSGMWLARLAREAQAAAAVVNPNVVGIVDIDVDASGTPFLVMELVNGRTLSASWARFGEPRFVREVVRQVACGLAALHEAGIVHRDLKPANVLIEPRQNDAFCAKIADFGIASLPVASDDALQVEGDINPMATTSEPAPAQPPQVALTGTGWMMGTPLYMAPELARGVKHAAPPCDLWSLGVLAYELGCGKLPFSVPPVTWVGDGPWQRPPLDTQSLVEPLRSIVERCLEVEPARRPTAADVAAALG